MTALALALPRWRPDTGRVSRAVVGTVLVAAGLLKLVAPATDLATEIQVLLPVPDAVAFATARVVPWLELLLGLSVLANRPRQAPWAAVGLLVVFTLLLARAAWAGTAVDGCACFGSYSSGSIHLDLVRNLVLTALAARATTG